MDYRVIVIGASAGGLQALSELVRRLPADLKAVLFVVVHTSADNPGILPKILGRQSSLPVRAATDFQEIRPGTVTVAMPDRHLLLKRGHIRVTHGPKENGFRPAVDPLFRTAASAYGPNVVGVILSGGLDDGVHGLILIKENGGVALAQSPDEAQVPSMPLAAIRSVEVDSIAPVADLATTIVGLCQLPVVPGVERMANLHDEPDIAEMGTEALQNGAPRGRPSSYTCPECGGSLWELDDDRLLRFRCHVGHGFTAESLLAEQNGSLEAALWGAVRALDENAALQRRMAEMARRADQANLARDYQEHAEMAAMRALKIREVIVERQIAHIGELAQPESDKASVQAPGRPPRRGIMPREENRVDR